MITNAQKIAYVFVAFEANAIEERYAILQSRYLLMRDAPPGEVIECIATDRASEVAARSSAEFFVLATSPLVAPPPHAVRELLSAMGSAGVAVPSMNSSDVTEQTIAPPELYLTLKQFENAAAMQRGAAPVETQWPDADPGIAVCRRERLENNDRPITRPFTGQRVTIARSVYAHRFASMRGQLREDLLALIDLDARTVLEIGCGEAPLAAALKQRQSCRVVGVELDPDAAVIARTRVDELRMEDVREVVKNLDERFDVIVGGDIVEHLDDPWTFLTDVRRVAAPGGKLILSLPNIACWATVADLLAGRLDYVYMGITCVGHLRFFTRRTISEMLAMTGWTEEEIRPQAPFETPEFAVFEQKLKAGGVEYSREDLVTPGFYVIASNR